MRLKVDTPTPYPAFPSLTRTIPRTISGRKRGFHKGTTNIFFFRTGSAAFLIFFVCSTETGYRNGDHSAASRDPLASRAFLLDNVIIVFMVSILTV